MNILNKIKIKTVHSSYCIKSANLEKNKKRTIVSDFYKTNSYIVHQFYKPICQIINYSHECMVEK